MSAFKTVLAAGAAGGLLGAKFYVGHKWLQWRQARKRAREGIGMSRSTFAGLPRKRQAGIIYYRRGRLREFEDIYGVGRRRRRLGNF